MMIKVLSIKIENIAYVVKYLSGQIFVLIAGKGLDKLAFPGSAEF